MDDLTDRPVAQEVEAIDTGAPADLSAELDRLTVIEAELAAAEAALNALDGVLISDPVSPAVP